MLLRNIWSEGGIGRCEPVLLAVVACSWAEAVSDSDKPAAMAAKVWMDFITGKSRFTLR